MRGISHRPPLSTDKTRKHKYIHFTTISCEVGIITRFVATPSAAALAEWARVAQTALYYTHKLAGSLHTHTQIDSNTPPIASVIGFVLAGTT